MRRGAPTDSHRYVFTISHDALSIPGSAGLWLVAFVRHSAAEGCFVIRLREEGGIVTGQLASLVMQMLNWGLSSTPFHAIVYRLPQMSILTNEL